MNVEGTFSLWERYRFCNMLLSGTNLGVSYFFTLYAHFWKFLYIYIYIYDSILTYTLSYRIKGKSELAQG